MEKHDHHYDSNAVIEGIRLGDTRILTCFYASHYRTTEKLILNNNGNKADAEDIFQDAIMVLYVNLQDPEFQLKCRPETYVFAVARYKWLKRLGRDKMRIFQELPEIELVAIEEVELIDFEMEYSKKDQLTRQVLLELGNPCKAILESYYFMKKSMETIAKEFAYKDADSAKNQKYKCLKRLQQIVLKRWDDNSNT